MRTRIALASVLAAASVLTIITVGVDAATALPPGQATTPAPVPATGAGPQIRTPRGTAAWEHAAPGTPRPAPAVRTFHAAPAPLTDWSSTSTANWACIRLHESGNRYNDPRAPSGAYGILYSTWHAFGFGAYGNWPYQAPASVQDYLALALHQRYGWGPWGTRFVCGL